MLWFEEVRGRALWQRRSTYCKIALPIYAFFAIIDRLYSFYRFGSLTQPMSRSSLENQRMHDPTLPAELSVEHSVSCGLSGSALQAREVDLSLRSSSGADDRAACCCGSGLVEVRAYALASLFCCLAISAFMRATPSGRGLRLGDRYVSTAVELVALISIPLLLRYRARLSPWIWRTGIAWSRRFFIQIASLMFWLPLEIYQMETLGHPTFVIALRFKNIVAFAFGKMDAVGPEYRNAHVRSVGLRSHHDLEFSAVPAAPRGRRASVGGRYSVRPLGRGVGGIGRSLVAAEDDSGKKETISPRRILKSPNIEGICRLSPCRPMRHPVPTPPSPTSPDSSADPRRSRAAPRCDTPATAAERFPESATALRAPGECRERDRPLP